MVRLEPIIPCAYSSREPLLISGKLLLSLRSVMRLFVGICPLSRKPMPSPVRVTVSGSSEMVRERLCRLNWPLDLCQEPDRTQVGASLKSGSLMVPLICAIQSFVGVKRICAIPETSETNFLSQSLQLPSVIWMFDW